MTEKPSAISHMIRWGFVSGGILATLFMLFVILAVVEPSILFSTDMGQEALGFVFFLAFFFGSVPGTILGIIEGWILHFLLKNSPYPFTKAAMNKHRWIVYSCIFLIPILTISSFLLLLSQLDPQSWLNSMIGFLNLFGIPMVIASIASVYAAHRYMFRLRLWSGDFDNAKIKAKHEHINSSRLALQDIDEAYVIPEIADSEQHEKRLS